MEKDIVEMIKEANLLGRGGASFPTWIKWDAVRKANGKTTYVIANGSEGEPGMFKDEYVLKHYPKEFIGGIKIALETFPNAKAVIFLNHFYFQRYRKKLKKLAGNLPIQFFKKTGRYIAGEETALISHIEGKRVEPRVKPPYPAQSGLNNFPTLVNNIETYHRVFQIKNGTYDGKTLFSISGQVKNGGVFEFRDDLSIRKILEKTKNYPKFDFFVQLGGGASGAIFLPSELDMQRYGAASIIVFDRKKTDPFLLMKYWADFYAEENCDKCTPCREGSMRIMEMINSRKLNYEVLDEIFLSLERGSFCPLGRGMATPYKTLISKVVKNGKL